jgi:hypothetical protein
VTWAEQEFFSDLEMVEESDLPGGQDGSVKHSQMTRHWRWGVCAITKDELHPTTKTAASTWAATNCSVQKIYLEFE